MENEIKDLKRLVEDLKSELAASMEREEMLLNPVGGGNGLKQRLKRTRLGRIAMDPNSKLGKVVRSPRTIARIVMHPGILIEMRNEKNKSSISQEEGEVVPLFAPIKFFIGSYNEARVNVVMEKIDLELLTIAIKTANSTNTELRIITYGESAAQMEYRALAGEKKIPKVKKVSFYSSVDQSMKGKMFELEVGKRDIFITRAWGENVEK